jgi:hypothetical protein
MKINLFSDILKEKTKDGNKYSQGRIYLFWSILAYYATLSVITFKSLKPNVFIDVDTLKLVIEGLQWSMGLFAGYVFGSKGVEVLKALLSKNQNNNNNNGGYYSNNVDEVH